MPQRIEHSNTAFKWLAASAVFVFLAAAIMAAVVISSVKPLQTGVDNLTNGNSPAGVARRQAQAEVFFVLCSRNDAVVNTDKQEDIAFVCDGYKTLEQAYKTQNVPAP